jgi:hypothetical protein
LRQACTRARRGSAALLSALPLRLLDMVHWLSSQTKVIRSLWSTRPMRTASLILLIAAVIVSGPWACLVHCRIIDAAYHRYHLHYHHAPADTDSLHSDNAGADYGAHESVSYVPTALTIAIILPIMLVLPLLVIPFWWQRLNTRFRSIMILPPRRPPRISMRFAF